MRYHILPEKPLQEQDYELMSLRHRDIQSIRKWRNDQIEYLRQRWPISETAQENYWEQVVFPDFQTMQPAQILLSFLLRGRCIGYGGLVHIDWGARRAEVSFLLETSRSENALTFQNEFAVYLKMLKRLAFDELKLNRLHTETFDVRPLVLKVLEGAGFKAEGRLRRHVNLEPDEKKEPRYVDSIVHGLLRDEWKS